MLTRNFIRIFTICVYSWAAPALANEKSPEIHLFTDDKNVTLIVLNPFDEPIEYIDSFNLTRDGPLGVYFKISSEAFAHEKEFTDEWIWPEPSRALMISDVPLILQPNTFVRKSWPMRNLVSHAFICDEGESCKRLLKFMVTVIEKDAFRENPRRVEWSYAVETPWVMYEVEQ